MNINRAAAEELFVPRAELYWQKERKRFFQHAAYKVLPFCISNEHTRLIRRGAAILPPPLSMRIKIDGGEGRKEEGEGERKSLMLDYWRLCLGQERERIEKLINEKNGVSCSTRISLSVFSFFNSDRYRYRSFFFFLSSLFSSPVCPVLFADLLLSVFLLFRLCQVNIEI